MLNFLSLVEEPPPPTATHEFLCKKANISRLCTSFVKRSTLNRSISEMLSVRPGHLENAAGHHHQLKGAPKTPGRQLKSGALRENAQSVHKIVLGGKQTPFHGKTRTSALLARHHRRGFPSSKFNPLTNASDYVLFWDLFLVIRYRTKLEQSLGRQDSVPSQPTGSSFHPRASDVQDRQVCFGRGRA